MVKISSRSERSSRGRMVAIAIAAEALREPERSRSADSEDDGDDDPGDHESAVEPAEAADLREGYPGAQQRHTQAQDPPCGEVPRGIDDEGLLIVFFETH